MKTTIVRNDFTGYSRTIRHKGETPSVKTIRRHTQQSKARDCKSLTRFYTEDGREVALIPDWSFSEGFFQRVAIL